MVYISTPMIPTASRQSLMQAQSDLAKTQAELASGTLADPGLTLGGQAGRIVTLGQETAKLQSITDSNTTASARLSATSSALDTIRTSASSFLTSLTAAVTSGSSTSSLGSTASSSLSALISALNTSVSGQHIFAGINTDALPLASYTASPASATKQAVDTAFATQFGTTQTSVGAGTIDGTAMQGFLDTSFASLFSASNFSGTWSSASDQVLSSTISASQTAATSVSANSDAFRQLAQAYTMVTEFTGQNLSSAAAQSVIKSALALTTSAVNSLTGLQAGVGITQSAITSANDSMAAQITLLSDQSTTLDGVDSYDLSTKVSSLQTQIQASYELTAKLQQMSLVNYLS